SPCPAVICWKMKSQTVQGTVWTPPPESVKKFWSLHQNTSPAMTPAACFPMRPQPEPALVKLKIEVGSPVNCMIQQSMSVQITPKVGACKPPRIIEPVGI